MKLFRIYCWITRHDLEEAPKECFKKEYNLPGGILKAAVCLRCKKVQVEKKEAYVDVNLARKYKAKKILGGYLYPPHKQRGVRCPFPWDAPYPSIPDEDEF